jgi:hypothetical protein
MKVRVLFLAAGALVAAAAGACGGPTQPPAKNATIFDTAGVYAFTGAPESGPTGVSTLTLLGLNFYGPTPVRAVPGAHFDVVFDIVNDTQAVARPPRNVGYTPTYNSGMQATLTPYDSMFTAPTLGYDDSMPMPIRAGTRFYMQSVASFCTAKFVIDSINFAPYDPITAPNGRTIYYRMVVDPNCGFLGLGPGIPTD